MSTRESLFSDVEPMTGPRIMTLPRQRLCLSYVESVVDAIEKNTLDASVLEALRRSGRYILTRPEVVEDDA